MPHPLRTNTQSLPVLPLINFGSALGADAELTINDEAIDLAYSALDARDNDADELAYLQAAHLAWDKTLNQSYQALLATLPKSQKAALQHSQRQWLDFRNTEWQSLDKRYAGKTGALYQIIHTVKRLEITKQRALQLRDYQTLLTH